MEDGEKGCKMQAAVFILTADRHNARKDEFHESHFSQDQGLVELVPPTQKVPHCHNELLSCGAGHGMPLASKRSLCPNGTFAKYPLCLGSNYWR